MSQATKFDREMVCDYLHKKLKQDIAKHHIEAVLSILLDEISNELKRGGAIVIKNFGRLFLKTMKPREHHNVVSGERVVSPGKRVLRLRLEEKIRKYLLKRLDIDKTFGAPYNEDAPK
jgi:nucleoid DNA-binding protein